MREREKERERNEGERRGKGGGGEGGAQRLYLKPRPHCRTIPACVTHAGHPCMLNFYGHMIFFTYLFACMFVQLLSPVFVLFQIVEDNTDHLIGPVVKASASGAKDPGFESRLRHDFSGSSHASDLKIGPPVATLPGAWRYRVSFETGRPGVSIL